MSSVASLAHDLLTVSFVVSLFLEPREVQENKKIDKIYISNNYGSRSLQTSYLEFTPVVQETIYELFLIFVGFFVPI